MMKALRKAIPVLMIFFASSTVFAQRTMDVSKFTRLDNDLMARVTKPVYDHDEGRLCALIRVVTLLTDLEVRADALGVVRQEIHKGEIWLYVPYGAKSVSFTHQGYYPLLYQYDLPIEDGTVYELRLSDYDMTAQDGQKPTNTQMFVLTHNPDDATVYMDEMEVPSENGVFAAMMSKGEHIFRVESPKYESVERQFYLGDEPLRESVKLDPLFGTFQVFTLPENDFDVYVDGVYAGVSPYKSERLDAGSYRLHIEKKDYYPVDTLIRLREGDQLNLTCKLTSYADSLFYNRRLGGRSVSFGVNVGYLMPFVSSKASGGFTGSPINYSFGDERENIDYTSQSGFSVGLTADIRLYKNFYLQTELNFSQYKYSNRFSSPIADIVVDTDIMSVYQGDMQNSYKEKYTLNMLELPIMASYRFVITKTGSLHLNLGPYVSYALSNNMDFSGSSDCSGNVYMRNGTIVDYSQVVGTFSQTFHVNEKLDLLSKDFSIGRIYESGSNYGHTERSSYSFDQSPFKKLNYGLKMGVQYELRGFQLGAFYKLQLSNMANESFWESSRIPFMNSRVGSNNMSGYKHRVNSLEIKLGYTFRY